MEGHKLAGNLVHRDRVGTESCEASLKDIYFCIMGCVGVGRMKLR